MMLMFQILYEKSLDQQGIPQIRCIYSQKKKYLGTLQCTNIYLKFQFVFLISTELCHLKQRWANMSD